MEIKYLGIEELVPYGNNPRDNSAAVEGVKNSIKEFGFKVPIVVDKDKVIVAGHTRFEAAKQLGMMEVPCIVADDLTDEQIKAFRLADNKVSEAAEWNLEKLDLELMDIENIDMSGFGFFEVGGDVADSEAQTKEESKLERMELRVFEHYDYLVFVFKNQMDWLNACTMFNIHMVNSGYGTTKKVGVGRVVDGTRLLEAVRRADNHPEQRASRYDVNDGADAEVDRDFSSGVGESSLSGKGREPDSDNP